MKKIFISLFIFITFSIIYLFNFPPNFILEYIKNETENQIIKSTNLYANIEKISSLRFGIFEQKAIAENIVILKGNNYKKDIFIKSKKLEIKFNLLFLLFNKIDKLKININIIEPNINLKRLKNGKFDIESPLFEIKKTKEKEKKIFLPSINLLIKNGFLNYKDFFFRQTLNLNTEIKYLRLKIIDGAKIFYDTDIYDNLAEIKLNGYFHLNNEYSNNGFQVKINNISKIINTFFDLRKYDTTYLSGGKINFSGYIKFDNLNFKNIKVNTNILLNELFFKNKKFNTPININKLNLYLTEKTINIKELNLLTLGSQLNLNLNSNISDNINFFKINLTGKNILLEKFLEVLKINIPLKSNINTNISLEGKFRDFKKYNEFIKYPTNIILSSSQSYIEGNNLKYQNIVSEKFSFNLKTLKDKIFLENINSNLMNGNVTGNLKIDNFKDFNIKNSNVNGTINLKRIEPYKYFNLPKFLINSEITLNGKIINPKINAIINIPSIDNFKKINIISKINYYNKNLSGNIISKSNYGNNDIVFNLNNFEKLYLKTNLKNIPLILLNNFLSKEFKFFSGYLNAYTEVIFSVSDFKNLNFKNITNDNNFFLKSDIQIFNSNLLFKNIIVNNINTNLKTNIFNKKISNYLLIKSGNLGNIENYLLVDKYRNIDFKLNINNFYLNFINNFLKDINLKKGYLNSNIQLNTNLNSLLNKDINNIKIQSNTIISHTSLIYKNINIDNFNSNLDTRNINNKLFSNIVFSSKQFEGNFKAFVNRNNVSGILKIDNLNAKHFNLINDFKIKNGFIKINTNFNTTIDKPLENLNLNSSVNIDNLLSTIKVKDKYLDLQIPNYKSNIVYKNSGLFSDNYFNSNFVKNVNFNFFVDKKNFLNSNFYAYKVDVKFLNIFLDNKDFHIKTGLLDTNLKLNFNYKKITKSLNVKGNAKLSNLKINYFNNLYKKIDYKNYLNDISSKNTLINSNDIDNLNINFEFKDNLLNIINFDINKNKSNINGNLIININTLLGKLFIKSNNISFNDFKIFKIYGFEKGNFKNLYINSSINNDYKKIFSEIFFSIENINSNETISGELKINKNILKINNILLKKKDSFFDIRGEINIDNNDIYILSNSKDFSIKNLIQLIPKKYIKKQNFDNLKNINIVYTLPNRNPDKLEFEDLLSYWEKNSLAPNESKEKSLNNIDLISSIDGNFSSECIIKGKLEDPLIDLEVMISNFKINQREITEIYLLSMINKKNIDIKKSYLLDKDGGYLELKGKYYKNNIDFKLNGKVNINILDNFVEKKLDLEGFHFLESDIKGTFDNPRINLLIYSSQDGGSFNKVYFDNFYVNSNLKDKIIDLKSVKLNSIGKEMKINGYILIDEKSNEMNVSALIKDNNLEIIDLFTNQIDWEKGKGEIFFNLQGNLYNPLITGKVNISDSKIFLSSLGNFLENLTLNVDINNNFIKINKANALFNNKQVDVIGQIDLVKYIPTYLKLKFFAEELKWKENGINLLAKTSLSITNTIDEPVIGGKVLIKKGEINFSLDSSSSTKKKLKSKKTSFISYNNLNIEIEKDTDFWVKSPFFELHPYGELNLLKGDLYNPIISGNIEIDKGNVFVINNQFNILSAKAIFGGKEFERDLFPLNPELIFIANTRLINPRTRENTIVEAKITAELEDIPKNNVKIEWTNKGGLKDDEIWSQVIGLSAAQQIIQETGSGNAANTIAKFATPYLSRALFNPLTSRVADLFSLDEFNVGLASDTISNPGVSISLSKPILGGLSIGYNGVIRASNQAQYNFFAKYKLNQNLGLRFNIDERQAISIQGEIGSNF
ncbi:MAG: hypothetical protein KatS3mg068_2120 [Candidatus Sericytochromatia bacterium]|nr:MAG: hypothetical protein KatS3mg068_2120 [Candidatus Sericytochromatia bacterium]